MTLKFDNTFIRELPGFEGNSNQPQQTPGVAYARTPPTPVKKPEMLVWSDEAASLLDLSSTSCGGAEDLAQIFSGNKLPPGMEPYATRYGGHQFGVWAHQLGDGRAISLGEVLNKKNERWEIQLKGAGLTPYSRNADGRAVLRSSLREFLCSEAMFHLGVPTTRALCCVTTGDQVLRDMFYDGHPANEPGAITTRLAPTFLRFGHYEILAANKEHDLLKKLVSYTIKTHFSELKVDDIAGWFREVCVRSAKLMSEWLRIGFVHGVMNTDNMSILGLTIDYGPYGFLDVYDPEWTPNTTDAGRKRYKFSTQPEIALWNLTKLAQSLLPIVDDKAKLEKGLELYQETFSSEFSKMMAHKLGLKELQGDGDILLIQELDQILRLQETDMTIFYRILSDIQSLKDVEKINEAFYSKSPGGQAVVKMHIWINKYLERRAKEKSPRDEIKNLMNKTNPVFILRNYLVQEALDGLEKGDRSQLDALMLALKTPYEKNACTQRFFAKRPEWARNRPGSSALSCSS